MKFKYQQKFEVIIDSNNQISVEGVTAKLLKPFAGGEDMITVNASGVAVPIAAGEPERIEKEAEEKAGPEVRDVNKWPPDKDGKYWCIVEGYPYKAMGRWLLMLDYVKEEGGFLQEDDGFRIKYWLTNDPQITIAGAKSEREEIAELREALKYLMEGVQGLPPLTAIEGTLIKHFEKAKKALNENTNV